jgi:hypothetical protein
MAGKIGMKDDEPAVVAVAAYRSSSPAWFDPVVNASRNGLLSHRGYKWNWNEPPPGAKRDADGLNGLRRFILWQHYAVRCVSGSIKINADSATAAGSSSLVISPVAGYCLPASRMARQIGTAGAISIPLWSSRDHSNSIAADF